MGEYCVKTLNNLKYCTQLRKKYSWYIVSCHSFGLWIGCVRRPSICSSICYDELHIFTMFEVTSKEMNFLFVMLPPLLLLLLVYELYRPVWIISIYFNVHIQIWNHMDSSILLGIFLQKILLENNAFDGSLSNHLTIAISHVIYCCSSARDNSKNKKKYTVLILFQTKW